MSSVKYFLKKNRIDVIIFLIFLLLSIEVTAVIFSGWKYVHQIDGWFTLDPVKQLDDVLYYWKDDVGFGYSSPDFHSIQFNSWQTGLLTFLNYFIDYWRSLVLSQFLIYFATFFAGMLSAFLFFGEFLRAFVADRVNFDKNKNKAI